MDRDFVAEFSGRYAWIFFAAVMLLLLAAVLFALFWMDGISPVLIPACLAVAVCMLTVFFGTVRKEGAAVEIANGMLILHRRRIIEIPLSDIQAVWVADHDGAFDISVHTAAQRYGMHCFIKDQRKQRAGFVRVRREKGIAVSMVNIGIGN